MMFCVKCVCQNQPVAYAGINFRLQGYGRPRRGSGRRSHPDAGEFSKICRKNFLIKLQEMHYFSLFFKKLQNYVLSFCAFGPRTQMVAEFLRKFWKFLMKIQ